MAGMARPTTEPCLFIYPNGMIIPGRASCNAFQGKQIHSTKTGKLNCYEYSMPFFCWIKENFDDNQVRLQLFAMAYNIGTFLQTLALVMSINDWSQRTMWEKLVKFGARDFTKTGIFSNQWSKNPDFSANLKKIASEKENPGSSHGFLLNYPT